MLQDEAPKLFELDKIDDTKPIYITEGALTSTRPSWKTRLLCKMILILGRLVGAVIFGFLITNLVREKSLKESTRPLIEEIR